MATTTELPIPEVLLALQERIASTNNLLADVCAPVAETILAWQKETANVAESLLPLHAEIDRAFEPIRRVLEEQQTIWAKQSQEIAEGLKRFETALEKAESVGRYGWTLPMDATPGEIVGIIESITDEASADAAFIDYFCANNGAYLDDLLHKTLSNTMLEYWKPTLEEALFCLREKKYRVCISSLMPILDGLCAQRFVIPQFQAKNKRKKFLDDSRQRATQSGSIGRCIWLSFIGFAETIFQDVDFSNPITQPSVVNRHLILHGRDIPQAKLEDCLRLLLALDTITKL